METRCANCNAVMSCDPRPDGDCWCAQLPPGPPLAGLAGCLCPACLAAQRPAPEEASSHKQRQNHV